MIDILKQIESDNDKLSELKEIQEVIAELDIETPNERQINALLFNMEDSHTPDRMRKYLKMNIERISLGDFGKWWDVVESFRVTKNPMNQFLNYCDNQFELDPLTPKYMIRKDFDSWYTLLKSQA